MDSRLHRSGGRQLTAAHAAAEKTTARKRCPWSEGHPLLLEYHDEEWGVPVHDDRRWYEKIVLDGAQAGLSWLTILKKREAYREAFAGFDPAVVARFGQRQFERLMRNEGIVRNRLKVQSAITNARAFLALQEAEGSFDAYVWRHVDGRPLQTRVRAQKDLPARTELSDALSRDLKKRGFTFVGSTIVYAFMQAAGLVNDHVLDCSSASAQLLAQLGLQLGDGRRRAQVRGQRRDGVQRRPERPPRVGGAPGLQQDLAPPGQEGLLARREGGHLVQPVERLVPAPRRELELDGGQLQTGDGAEAGDPLVEAPERRLVAPGGPLGTHAPQIIVGARLPEQGQGALVVVGGGLQRHHGLVAAGPLEQTHSVVGVAGDVAVEQRLGHLRPVGVDQGAPAQQIDGVVGRRQAGRLAQIGERRFEVTMLAVELGAREQRRRPARLTGHPEVGGGDLLVKGPVPVRGRRAQERGHQDQSAETHGAQPKTMVRFWWMSTRRSRSMRTARVSTCRSSSRPLRTRSSTSSRWLTRQTSCSMIGP
jgi:DNA-3-methyladenine glycosylase I